VKLVIQIPCLNESETLPQTLADLPTVVEGFDCVEFLVIDDGSTDGTSEVARSLGVHHVVRFATNRGLAAAYRAGIRKSLAIGADVIVNTDADNQYYGADICKLVAPIVAKEADLVVGERTGDGVHEFPAWKKVLQKLGSYVVRQLSNTEIPDAVSGFRAITRETALRMNVVSTFSYTVETLVQAGNNGFAVCSVPVRTNKATRESRLFKSTLYFIARNAVTLLRIYAMYRPLRVFSIVGGSISFLGVLAGLRFVISFLTVGTDAGKIQSLILCAILLIIGFQILVLGVIADMIAANRRIIENIQYNVRVKSLSQTTSTNPENSDPNDAPDPAGC
jgi:glycosyltransferase involved in cell wall biosynthesis